MNTAQTSAPKKNVKASKAPAAPAEAPKRGRAKPAAKAIDTNEQHGPHISQDMRDAERRANDDRRKSDQAMAFSAQQLTTPQAPAQAQAPQVQAPAPLEAPPEATAGIQALIEAAKALGVVLVPNATNPNQLDHATTATQRNTRAPAQPRQAKNAQNGITRPGDNTKCGMIWAACDRLTTNNNGEPATIADLKMQNDVGHFNNHTLKTQYARWRSYNGVTGRHVPTAQAAPQAPATQNSAPL